MRGELVVRGALEATLEELAEHGYDAFRIEDVAARVGVNKTTIYRRWPTKEELVRAALLSITSDDFVPPETGSLRGDLLELARITAELIRSCEGRGLFHMIQTAGPHSELMSICRSLKARYDLVPQAVVQAASRRGEIREGVDPMLLFAVLGPAIEHRLIIERGEADETFLVGLVDLMLYGAQKPAVVRTKSARAKAPATRSPASKPARRRARSE